jgi:hypothetical protein
MKTRFPFFCVGLASLSVTTVLLTRVAGSAAPPEKVLARTRGPVAANASNGIPVSVFTVPTNKVAGRDPFFPDCDCGSRIVVKVPDTTTSTGPSVGLVYMGRSGAEDRPLVIINGKTFEAGETQDVSTSAGTKISIRVVELKESSVIVEIGGKQRQELFLRGK